MSEEPEYRCFIGGLAWSTSDRSLKEAFDEYGKLVEAKIEEVVKDFRAITNKYMLKLENCKEKLEGLKSGIEVFQSEHLTVGSHVAKKRANWLSEKIKRSIKAAKQSAALD